MLTLSLLDSIKEQNFTSKKVLISCIWSHRVSRVDVHFHVCVFLPLHRHGGPGSSEITGGRRSLQGFTDLTQRHASSHCLCKYSVNKHWLSVSGAAAGLVICVPCRRTCQAQVSDPLARVGCNLRRARGLPSLVFSRPGCYSRGWESTKARGTTQGKCYTVQPAVLTAECVNVWVSRTSRGFMSPSVSADKPMKRPLWLKILSAALLFIPSSLFFYLLYHLQDKKHHRSYVIQHLLHNEIYIAARRQCLSAEQQRACGASSGGNLPLFSHREHPITTYVHRLSFSHAI